MGKKQIKTKQNKTKEQIRLRQLETTTLLQNIFHFLTLM